MSAILKKRRSSEEILKLLKKLVWGGLIKNEEY